MDVEIRRLREEARQLKEEAQKLREEATRLREIALRALNAQEHLTRGSTLHDDWLKVTEGWAEDWEK